jgi:hypothetical protein
VLYVARRQHARACDTPLAGYGTMDAVKVAQEVVLHIQTGDRLASRDHCRVFQHLCIYQRLGCAKVALVGNFAGGERHFGGSGNGIQADIWNVA